MLGIHCSYHFSRDVLEIVWFEQTWGISTLSPSAPLFIVDFTSGQLESELQKRGLLGKNEKPTVADMKSRLS